MSRKNLDLEWVRSLAATLKKHGLHSLDIETEEVSVKLRARSRPLQLPPLSPPTVMEKDEEEALALELVRAQNVGIFRSTVKLKVGEIISKGKKLGSVESISLQHDLISDRAGRLVEILVADGDPVEYGQPLLVLSTEDTDV